MNEFDLIKRYFTQISNPFSDTVLEGPGDDCAIVRLPAGYDLHASMDTLVSGVHFFPESEPEDIASKVLRSNISDIAAMGAVPKWYMLSLTLPATDEAWLERFSSMLAELNHTFQLDLIGGDITRGPLAITVQIMGLSKQGQALRRSAAKVGDGIFVSRPLGAAALACHEYQHGREPQLAARRALYHPEPELLLGQSLLGRAHAAIDISDGLLQDLGHILTASGVGAEVHIDKIPLSPLLNELPNDEALRLALSGDDYALCFTAPKTLIHALEAIYICDIVAEPGVRFFEKGKAAKPLALTGYQHFKDISPR